MVAVGIGALTLASCSGYKPGEEFANCNVKEFRGYEPVKLRHKPVDRQDVDAIREAVKESPDILIATAKSLHMLGKVNSPLDDAHDDDSESTLFWTEVDFVDNPGDILCQVTPLGSEGNDDRQVYFDQDGLSLLKAVARELDEQYPGAR